MTIINGSNHQPTDYMPGLDGVRALAIVPVILIHLGSYFSKEWWDMVSGGFLGVDLFFVLSGFLITSILTREYNNNGTIRFRKFYIKRALRLLPAIIALLIVHAIYAYATALPWDLEMDSLRAVLFYYANFKIAYSLNFAEGMSHMWSLSIEEQFYVLWPVILLLLGPLMRTRPKIFVCVILLAILTVALWRAWLWSERPSDSYWWFLYLRTDTRADSLLMGAFFAVISVPKPLIQRWLPIAGNLALVTLLSCMIFLKVEDAFLYRGGMTVVAFASGLIIFSVARLDGWWASVFENSIARGIGRISYGLYIWHMPVFAATARYTESYSLAIQIALALMILVSVTLISWFFIEKPFLRMKSRYA